MTGTRPRRKAVQLDLFPELALPAPQLADEPVEAPVRRGRQRPAQRQQMSA